MTTLSHTSADIVATAPTVYGIETDMRIFVGVLYDRVATAPTVYGIETEQIITVIFFVIYSSCNSTYRLRY